MRKLCRCALWFYCDVPDHLQLRGLAFLDIAFTWAHFNGLYVYSIWLSPFPFFFNIINFLYTLSPVQLHSPHPLIVEILDLNPPLIFKENTLQSKFYYFVLLSWVPASIGGYTHYHTPVTIYDLRLAIKL